MDQSGANQIPMDVIAGIVFKQTVEIEILRGQLAKANQVISALRKKEAEEKQKKDGAENDVAGQS